MIDTFHKKSQDQMNSQSERIKTQKLNKTSQPRRFFVPGFNENKIPTKKTYTIGTFSGFLIVSNSKFTRFFGSYLVISQTVFKFKFDKLLLFQKESPSRYSLGFLCLP